MSELRARVLSAVLAIPVAVAVVYAGGPALALLLAALGALATYEVYELARRHQPPLQPLRLVGIALAAAIPAAVHVHRLGWLGQPLALGALLFLALLGASLFATRVDERPLASVAVAVFAPLYTGGLLAFGYLLRHHPWTLSAAAGTALVGFPVVTTWLSDIGAYFVGKSLGRTKLMPAVSPGKTRAGAVGALIVAALGAVAYDHYVLLPHAQFGLGWARAAAFGLAISAVGQVGDLVKSLFKREAGVKDSGRLLAGHGGALDRLDSLLFALPVTYFLLGTVAGAAFRGGAP